MFFTTDLSVLVLGSKGWQQEPFPVCWCCRAQTCMPQTPMPALTGHLEQITLPPPCLSFSICKTEIMKVTFL